MLTFRKVSLLGLTLLTASAQASIPAQPMGTEFTLVAPKEGISKSAKLELLDQYESTQIARLNMRKVKGTSDRAVDEYVRSTIVQAKKLDAQFGAKLAVAVKRLIGLRADQMRGYRLGQNLHSKQATVGLEIVERKSAPKNFVPLSQLSPEGQAMAILHVALKSLASEHTSEENLRKMNAILNWEKFITAKQGQFNLSGYLAMYKF